MDYIYFGTPQKRDWVTRARLLWAEVVELELKKRIEVQKKFEDGYEKWEEEEEERMHAMFEERRKEKGEAEKQRALITELRILRWKTLILQLYLRKYVSVFG